MGNMSILVSRIMLTSFVCFLWVAAVEAGVYRWYDEQGHVHYGDKANSGKNSVKIKIDKAPQRDKHAEERLRKQKEYAYDQETQSSDKSDPANKERLARSQKEREGNCKQLKSNLALLTNTARIYKEAEDGIRRFLDDKDRAEELKLTNQQISDFCQK